MDSDLIRLINLNQDPNLVFWFLVTFWFFFKHKFSLYFKIKCYSIKMLYIFAVNETLNKFTKFIISNFQNSLSQMISTSFINKTPLFICLFIFFIFYFYCYIKFSDFELYLYIWHIILAKLIYFTFVIVERLFNTIKKNFKITSEWIKWNDLTKIAYLVNFFYIAVHILALRALCEHFSSFL